MPGRAVRWLVLCPVAGILFLAGCPSRPANRGQQGPGTEAKGKAGPPPEMRDVLCGPETTLPLLMANALQEEFNLAPDQKEKLNALKADFKAGKRGHVESALQGSLLPNQIERLNQLCLQMEWANLLSHPMLQKTLDITEDQKTKMVHIREEVSKQVTQLLAKSNPQEVRKNKQAVLKEARVRLLNVLNAAQKEKLEALKGGTPAVDMSTIYATSD